MGRKRSRIDCGTIVLDPHVWDDFIRLGRKVGDHAFWPRSLSDLADKEIYEDTRDRNLLTNLTMKARNGYLAYAHNDTLGLEPPYPDVGQNMPHHSNLGLPQPFPQALGKYPSKFGFYCYRESNRFCFHNFHSAYAAKHFLELMIDGRDVKWLKTDTILIDGDVKIRGEQGSLETIMEYELKPKEREWEIPEPHISHYRQFLGKQKSLEQPDNPTPQQVMRSPVNTSSVDPVKRQKAKLKVQAGDHITIGQIAQELGKDPRDCRAALRALKVAKPDHGQWSWPKGEAENIKKKLKGKVK